MVVGIGLHGGHHTLLPRKWMTDRNTTTSTIFRNVRQSNTSPPFWHLCPTEMVRITITTMNLPSKSLQELCQWSWHSGCASKFMARRNLVLMTTLQYEVFIRYSRFHQPENSGAAKVWVCGWSPFSHLNARGLSPEKFSLNLCMLHYEFIAPLVISAQCTAIIQIKTKCTMKCLYDPHSLGTPALFHRVSLSSPNLTQLDLEWVVGGLKQWRMSRIPDRIWNSWGWVQYAVFIRYSRFHQP